MRTLILTNYDLGLYQFRRELIAELLKQGEVYISLPYGKLVDPIVEDGCKFIDTPMERRGMNPKTDLKLFNRYLEILSEVKPDRVITYTIKPNVYGGIACALKNIPYAVNITGLGTAFQGHGMLRKMVTAMYKAALKRARVVFFENSANRNLFISERIVRVSQTCLLNGAGVNTERFQYVDYPDNEVFRFLFIGRVMKEKGIDELFEAMLRLGSGGYRCILDVVGPCEENYEEKLAQYAHEGWVQYRGFREDVKPFIKSCDCFVLPSYHEGMANTNLECAASGRPVITSKIPGCKEAVLDGVSGMLCKPQNVDSLYDSMKKMLDLNRIDRILMGQAGRKHMIDKFDKRRVVSETISALNRKCGS